MKSLGWRPQLWVASAQISRYLPRMGWRLWAALGALIACAGVAGGSSYGFYELNRRLDVIAEHDATQSRQLKVLTDLARLLSPTDGEHRRLDIRKFAITSQLAQSSAPIVVIGDSITEAALLPTRLCGHPLINAGIGGLTAGNYADLAPGLLAERKIAALVIALGINDANRTTGSTDEFVRQYRRLLAIAGQASAHLIIAGVPPIDADGALAPYFDIPRSEEIDAKLAKIAADAGLPFVSLRGLKMREPGTRVDGVHLTAKGYEAWQRAVIGAVQATLDCASSASPD
ncbi:lysophospholipase L1-like esterase [Bradyrhizobium sp. i1.15.2]|uniref:SGNH/GDSL hydrolase family protein n=1 Tax=Bradyrhizobium sp. i1.15.2 TaxID=3156362 RepID=UPI003399AEB0